MVYFKKMERKRTYENSAKLKAERVGRESVLKTQAKAYWVIAVIYGGK